MTRDQIENLIAVVFASYILAVLSYCLNVTPKMDMEVFITTSFLLILTGVLAIVFTVKLIKKI